MTSLAIELFSGLSALLSGQLGIAEADKAFQLAKEAEIKALQAQISPHFLFNSLNVIVSLIRIDPDKARRLLVSLSHFLRQNLTTTTVSMTTLEQELKHTKAYLAIEEARFVDKLKVFYESAIKHGIKDRDHNCIIKVSIKKQQAITYVKVIDNGHGINEEKVRRIGKETIESESGSGLALYNVNRRLTMMFGSHSALSIKSVLGKGSTIGFAIPQAEDVIDGKYNQSVNS